MNILYNILYILPKMVRQLSTAKGSECMLVGGLCTSAHTKVALSRVKLRTGKNKCLLQDRLGNSEAEALTSSESL